ncbi:MAG TPA: response regulator transcription factor [Chthoniobacteraceae bacterium]|jgi:DNA-binding NarL/FixJ family response regulator|nr:response regulator transcription factor [Chthoniobacteraceae bacterium]
MTHPVKPLVPTEKKRVFIVDDHPIFRKGLEMLISMEADLTVCGEASESRLAIDALRQIEADVVLVDISLPGADGIELVKHLRAEHPKLPILVITAYDEKTYGLRALRAGATGYLTKREGETHLVAAVRSVLSGKIWVSPDFKGQLIYKIALGAVDGDSPLDALSDRELEVLHLLGEGKSSQEISEKLNLSIKTIETHRLHIKQKLELKSSSDLVRFALELKREV